ncbi:MAG TPA: hemerythrin domain-containing protein, partial [Chthoniobacterales bacterium]|nr:hemerythrin domain-containing protein [Chthoniobacterales bacterium]
MNSKAVLLITRRARLMQCLHQVPAVPAQMQIACQKRNLRHAILFPEEDRARSFSHSAMPPVWLKGTAETAMTLQLQRRRLFQATTGLVVAGAVQLATTAHADENQASKVEEVTPPEDLMREHGVLNRVLLIYDAVVRKIDVKEDFDPGVISNSARIVQQFIEGYHERNEEQQLFPRFRQAGQLVDLVKVLYQQHQAGRRLTDTILGLVPSGASLGDARIPLVQAMRSFIAMYRPHE